MAITPSVGNKNFSGIEGKFSFQLSIGNKEWEISPPSLLRFLVDEEAGNVAPAVQLDFTTKDASILKYLNEGNVVKVTAGGLQRLSHESTNGREVSNEYQKMEISITIVRLQVKYELFPYIQIYCSGIAGNYDYLFTPRMRVINQKNSLDAIKDIVNNNGKFSRLDSTVKLSPIDTQNWIQYNITDMEFLSEVWLHSYIPDKVMLVGINSMGSFVIRDSACILQDLKNKNYKYTFTNNFSNSDSNNKKLIQYGGVLFSQSNSIMNLGYTYGRERVVYNLEQGTEAIELPEINNAWLSLSAKLNRKDTIAKMAAHNRMINTNVHSKYNYAYDYNVGRLSALSSTNLIISFSGKFINDLQILDPINVTVNKMDSSQLNSQYESGGYIVAKITRSIMNGSLNTTVVGCRESVNEMSGSFR